MFLLRANSLSDVSPQQLPPDSDKDSNRSSNFLLQYTPPMITIVRRYRQVMTRTIADGVTPRIFHLLGFSLGVFALTQVMLTGCSR